MPVEGELQPDMRTDLLKIRGLQGWKASCSRIHARVTASEYYSGRPW